MKIQIQGLLEDKLKELELKLRERGVKEFDLGELVSDAFSSVSDRVWESLIEAKTPESYLLERAMSNPAQRQAILAIIGKTKRRGRKRRESKLEDLTVSPTQIESLGSEISAQH